MQLNARQFVMQFAHLARQDLFPCLETTVGPLTPQLLLLASVVALLPWDLLAARRSGTGRPPKDRTEFDEYSRSHEPSQSRSRAAATLRVDVSEATTA